MWDQRYDTEDYVYGTEPNDFLREAAHSLPKGKVLCLAEGEGRNAVYLATQGYEVTAVDSSAVGLRKAQELAESKGVSIHCIVADLQEFELGQEQWDGIVSIFCHLPPPLRQKVYAQIPASLRSGGVLLLEGYTPEQLQYKTGGPPVAALMLSKEILASELSELEVLKSEEVVREIQEGQFHKGQSAVVQYLGKKS
jgi:2-polyprenyl-3-methyl-5-hydroxy-6-metoxy-1,4-benzoquinol methylase